MRSEERYGVRAGVLGDLADIEKIERVSFARPWSPAQLHTALHGPRNRCLVAVDRAGALLAYCFVQVLLPEFEIQSLAVSPPSRRAGIGRFLVGAVIDRAREAGAVKVLLEVRAGNSAAAALYRSMGFVEDTVREGYYDDGENAVLMSRLV